MAIFRRGGSRERVDERDVLRLDRDLRQIVIEERCSYGPELRRQLVEAHARAEGPSRSRSWLAPAAGIAAVLVLTVAGSLALPRARGALLGAFRSPGASEAAQTTARGPRVGELAAPASVAAGPGERAPHAPTTSDATEQTGFLQPPPMRPGTVPELLDRTEARTIVAHEYPDVLQQKGVGGRVRILMWVGPEGTTEFPQIEHSSGLRELDLAALRATQALRFVPATRLGEAVGTWVSFSIRFQPGGTDVVQPDPEYATFHIPLSN